MAASKTFPGFFNAKITRKIDCVYAAKDEGGTTKTLVYMATEDGTHIIAFPDPTERPTNNLMNMAYYDSVDVARKVWARMAAGRKLLSKKVIK